MAPFSEVINAIAIKRAEVHWAAEIMWAEHQLTPDPLAIEACAEIDREQQRRRVVEALEGPVRSPERTCSQWRTRCICPSPPKPKLPAGRSPTACWGSPSPPQIMKNLAGHRSN